MAYKNKTTGEIISDQDYQTKFGAQIQSPSATPIQTEKPSTGVSFLERLKLGFGGSEAKAKQQQIESDLGLKGKLDIGDIADVAGAALPVIGGALGAIPAAASTFGLGAAGGAAVGAAAGQGVRRLIGGMIGADQPSVGDVAGDVALTGIGTAIGGKVLGSIFNAVSKTIPQKLVSTIFKQSADDIATGIKTGGKNLTQSEEILKEGFKGSTQKMMTQAWETMKTLESQTQAKVAGQVVNIANKKGYTNLISDYINNIKKVSFGFEPQIVKDGTAIINGMNEAKGNAIPGEIALAARRFIDNIRRTSSFKLNPNLAPKEQFYKKAADTLRSDLATQVSGLSDIMKRYAIHINAFEDLAKHAAATQNKDLFDLLDVFIMYGINPTAYLARRGLTSGAFKTYTAQGLSKFGDIVNKTIPTGAIPAATTQGVKRLFGQ